MLSGPGRGVGTRCEGNSLPCGFLPFQTCLGAFLKFEFEGVGEARGFWLLSAGVQNEAGSEGELPKRGQWSQMSTRRISPEKGVGTTDDTDKQGLGLESLRA